MLCLKHSDQPSPDDLLEPAEAARLLGVNPALLDVQRRERALSAYKVPARWLYRRSDLERLGSLVRKTRTLAPTDPIGWLRLTTRARNALMSEGIETVGQLARCRSESLLKIPNLGRGSIETIEQALAEVGYQLGTLSKPEASEEEALAPEIGAKRLDAVKHVKRNALLLRQGPQYPTA